MKPQTKPEKKNVLADLQAAIKAQIKPHVETPAPAPAAKHEIEPPARAEKKPHGKTEPKTTPAPAPNEQFRSGRGVQFYLDDRDRKVISNLAVWFASQDRRVSDSQVIKAAVRFASLQPNARLLEVCDEVRASDRRWKSKKTPGPKK